MFANLRSRILWSLIGIVGIAAFSGLLDRLTTPWANPFSSVGTLTGEWAGTAHTPTGRLLRLWLSIALHSRSSGCRGSGCRPYGEDTATTCDELGRFRRYRITATVPHNDDTRLRISVTPPPETANEVRFSDFSGSRSGDILRLKGRLHAPGPVTTRLWTDEQGNERRSMTAGHPDAEANTA
ncbi:hypothetical protein EAH89_24820 [Roseomonas nepalensis]|uniref:Uncharacterized protein n=1 Tax=Muricoccus nepalensis TaxID=1854500 RepID=A0A502FAM9_9PROT|nr:nicotinamide mononucleotide transporter [Roseomonas nepalensis]TPG46437.1 hypothetical protein EAH89_24820 [Roseomonas nepalensis]